jgi:hypothetical protein
MPAFSLTHTGKVISLRGCVRRRRLERRTSGVEGKVSIAAQLFGPSSSSQGKDYRSPTNESTRRNGVICRFCDPERYSRLGLVGTSFSW